MTSPAASGYEYLKHHGTISDSACNNTFQREESSYCQSSYDKTSVKSRSMLMDKELMREEEIRWSSGVIAKLMGLDEQIPQRLVHKRKRVADGFTQKLSVAGIQGKYLIKDEHLFHMNMADHHEFNDNNDALETVEVEREKRKTVAKALPSLRQYNFDISKECKSNVSSPGQSSMDAMEIPSNKLYKMANKSGNNMSRQYSREHHFLRFQKEPNFRWLAPSHLESKKAISESHTCISTTGEVSSPLNRITDRFPHMKKDGMCYFQRPMTCMASSSPIHPSVSFSYKLSQQHAARKNRKCIHHNHSRVKPNNDRSLVNGQMFYVTTPENFWSARRRRTAQPRIKETHNQGQNLKNFSLSMEGFGCREIARETTEELRESICRDKKHMPIFGLNILSGNGSSCTMPDMRNLLNSGTFRRSSGYFEDWSSNHDPGLAYSVKSRGSEAQKNLPKLKMTNYIKEGHYNIGSSQSAEYCLKSDMERKGKAYNSSAVHSFSDEKPSSTRASCDSYMTVSPRKCLDGRFFLNLPKPTIVPVPSTAIGNQNARLHQSNSQRFCSVDDVLTLRPTKINQIGNLLSKSIKRRNHKLDYNLHRHEKNSSTREIHMAQENKTTAVPMKASSKGNYKLLYVPSSADMDMFLKTTMELDKLSTDKTNSKNIKVSNTDMKISVEIRFDARMKNTAECNGPVKDLSSDHLQVDCDFHNHERRKKASQSCLVFVPEAPVREDDSGISITQNIDLHGHPSKELTSISQNPGVKSSKMLRLSNEDSREESDLIPQSIYLEEDFMDKEERDYTYLLDILFVSGIHSSKQNNLFNACHLPEYPVNPTLFEKLEKKFGKLVSWSKSERKLMFDMTNSTLAEILAPCMDPLPWVNSIRTIGPMWSSEGLIERSWKILVKKRAELSFGNAEDKALDFKWLDLGDHINDIGCEIARLLKEELLEELVEFIQG
ncbi:hypothetical protein ZIOFF_001692 [Zingiber officinale]|uniref:DUF4378 domain-containing protein n=1 Tax=Zingiber officinale TaxID=94328 RepID=A0A8J5I628_ZINOF|nr:hypothetical protein ZIOFF_001692 [Zingiber officinale]